MLIIDDSLLERTFSIRDLGVQFDYQLTFNTHSKIDILVPRPTSRYNSPFLCKGEHTNLLLKSPIHLMCYNANKTVNVCDILFCNIFQLKSMCWEYL